MISRIGSKPRQGNPQRRSPQRNVAPAPQYFFVSGSPKSGTTWLQRILDAHPDVVCSGEGHFVTDLLRPLLALRKHYNSKLEVVAERVYEGKPYYPPLAREDIAAVARALILRLMRRRAAPASKAIGDKTPRYAEYLDALSGLFPEARFINVVRHPYDVAVSMLYHSLRAGMKDAITPGTADYMQLVAKSARSWTYVQLQVADFAARHPGRLLQVRYEDLHVAPLRTATAAFAFLGVSSRAQTVEAALAAASFEALSGRKPGEEDAQSFFRKGVAGGWKGSLDEPALQLLDELCADQLRKEGYRTAQEELQTNHNEAASNR